MDFLITGRMQMTDRSADIAMRVYQVLAWCFFLGVLVQVTLAGVSIFVGGTRWQLHRNVGHAFSLPLFTMLLLAVLARLPRRYIGYAAVADPDDGAGRDGRTGRVDRRRPPGQCVAHLLAFSANDPRRSGAQLNQARYRMLVEIIPCFGSGSAHSRGL
jgi:hypothetical protein